MAADKKFSIIVPLYKEGYKTIDTFVMHLKEQDYKNFEVIFVLNSPDDKAKSFITNKHKLRIGKIKWSYLDAGYDETLGNGNHCRAFNVGAAAANGDYLLFLDPDVYLLPGILREYKDAFDQHPDVQFVYGDYDFTGDVGRIPGRTYSEYELRCGNYISGGFPVRREAFKGWDENLKSLQDWDMWLSVVDAGGKGFYIGRPCFRTDPTQGEGISKYTVDHWLKMYKKVREKHGFPVSDTVVTSLGAPMHATNAAKHLGADSRVDINIFHVKPHEYKNLYVLGFYPKGWQGHMSLFYEGGQLRDGTLAGKKRIIHWIGTDIFQMQHDLSFTAWKNIQMMLNDKELGFTHLCEFKQTQDELAELGIRADIVPLPPEKMHNLMPLPEEFTVGVYVNPTQDMYFEEFMYTVAEAMPDVKFKFFGNKHMKNKVEDNKEWVGWVDMADFLPTISALVRITRHDGLPLGPIEAMQAGRNVLASVPLKHALQTKVNGDEPDLDDVVAKIRQMQDMGLNEDGSAYWRHEMSPELYKKRMRKYLA